jgi:hypothetical protein
MLVLLLLDSDSYELFNSIGLSRKNESDKFGIYRKDRLFDPGHEGGVVINAIRKDVISSGEITLETDCELTWNKIQIKGSKPCPIQCPGG